MTESRPARRRPRRCRPRRRGASTIVPAAGEGTSASTLSVEISTSTSSAATASPSCLCHSRIVPSVTESPICGMTTWMVVFTATDSSLYPVRAPCGLRLSPPEPEASAGERADAPANARRPETQTGPARCSGITPRRTASMRRERQDDPAEPVREARAGRQRALDDRGRRRRAAAPRRRTSGRTTPT